LPPAAVVVEEDVHSRRREDVMILKSYLRYARECREKIQRQSLREEAERRVREHWREKIQRQSLREEKAKKDWERSVRESIEEIQRQRLREEEAKKGWRSRKGEFEKDFRILGSDIYQAFAIWAENRYDRWKEFSENERDPRAKFARMALRPLKEWLQKRSDIAMKAYLKKRFGH
jgi:hypothetical protein